MRTPITYYGGKQRLADDILSIMPYHKIYCEPFFGGGALFFRKPKAGLEVINDHDAKLINFYDCVQNRFDELEPLIKQSLCSESMYYYAKDVWNERVFADDIEKAWAIWVITNASFAGSMHGGWKYCNGSSGSHTGIYLRGKRADFSHDLHKRLEDVQISCRDALRVIKDRDSPETFFYLDPPYPGCYQQHYSGYTFKMFAELLELISQIEGKFILSNYWSQTLKYFVATNKWNTKAIEINMKISNLGKKSKVSKRTEYLVYNYDIQKTLFD